MKQKILIAGAIIAAIFLWFAAKTIIFLTTPMLSANQQPISFILPQGASVRYVAHKLKEQNLLAHANIFVWVARLEGNARNFKAGEYSIDSHTTPLRLIHKMAVGDMENHEFTIIEGWNFDQIYTALENNPYLQHTLQGLSSAEVMRRIGHEGEVPEGRFAPNTYLFSGKTNDIDVLRGSYQLMQKWLQDAWDHKAANVPYHCPYQALIVASIVEKESAYDQEKPLIAGVMLHRLQIDMPLQVDPTVIYGLGSRYTGKLTAADLTHDTPYNTYMHRGLPPSPISSPSQTTIEAIMHPVIGTALYYVAKGDGTHVFSDTLQEHDENRQVYNTGRR